MKIAIEKALWGGALLIGLLGLAGIMSAVQAALIAVVLGAVGELVGQ